MAKIGQKPSLDTVDAFRGVLDFYQWCDLNIVRSWPQWRPKERSPEVVAAQIPFAYLNQLAGTLSTSVSDSYRELASSTGLTWKDYLNRLYINPTIGDTMTPSDADYVLTSEAEMKLVILDPEVQKAIHNNIAVSVGWTDIDLTPDVSPYATVAIMRGKLQCNSANLVNDYGMTMRGKGQTQAVDLVHWWAGVVSAFCLVNDVIVPLDINRKLQYKIDIPVGGGSIYATIWVVGYGWEV